MFLNSIAATNVGKIRENNEDNFFLCGKYKKSPEVENMIVSDCRPRRRYLFGVCDGMGGADYGEIAALIAVETMSEYWENASADICGCAQDANLKICSAIESNESKRMGATFAAALVEDNIAHIYNVGDSRVYLIYYVMDTESTYKTQYRYRDASIIYLFGSDWSSYSDTYQSSSSSKDVHTRTVYRYCDRSRIPTYHYQRWGNWSSWGTTAPTANNSKQVENATFYRYRERMDEKTYIFYRYTDWSDWSSEPIPELDNREIETAFVV